jgi:beta-lactam-binding protein with PASTA domain/tRNA A-37 threonylcarbamoyl transferase component Bud32
LSERLDIGSVVDGRYRIISRLGSGGMADVYCAEDLQLGRRVALKVLYRRFAEDQEFVERFRREASSAAGLQHQHVVSVYDRGEWDGTYWIAMEYLEGRSLKRLIQEEGPLAPERAIDLAEQILRAARFAHRRGIIHRDLKPHNVIVDDGPPARAKVTDFGIARAGASDMTQTGSIMGTAQYLSPEQAQGHAVSAQSDIYSVGIILYEMLTGRVPFDGESAVTIALKQVSAQPVPPSQLNPAISPGLEAAVMRALAKDPAQRYPDADAFIAALHGQELPPTDATAIAPSPAAPPPPPPVALREPTKPPPMLPASRDDEDGARWWAWLIGLLIVAALIVGGVLLLSGAKKVGVPDVVGASQAAAEKALRDKGFSTDSTFETSPKRQGEVIGQDPPGGTHAKKGSTVHLTVSGGPGQATVPTVTGLGRRAAAKKLTRAGFKVTESEQFDDTIAKDHVIETRPVEGTPLDKGTRVTLVVSKGPEQVALPDETGKTLDDARNDLENLGFTVSVKRQESATADPDTVLSQDPASGLQDKGSNVTLTVAKQPAAAAVPDETGKQDTDAVSALQDAGFAVSITHQDTQNLAEDGIVLSQDPNSGHAKRGSTVKLVVGRFNPNLQGDGTTTTPTTTPTTP